MFLQSLHAQNFRNYELLDLEFHQDKPVNVIVSPNGMGKSNLLEMIYYLSYFRPFRSVIDKELVKKKEKHFYLKCSFLSNELTNNISISYQDKKIIQFNHKKAHKYSELLGKLLSVLFCNEDIFIINGSPTIRRKFFDIFISIIDREYLENLKKFYHLIKQKNKVLKDPGQHELITIYNIQLAPVIAKIIDKRKLIIEKISTSFKDTFKQIGMFDKNVKIVYLPSLKLKNYDINTILGLLESQKKKEIENGHTMVGPHRDNYLFLLNGIVFSKYASFGQTRLAALVLKLVQTEFYRKEFKVQPILLLDDVILELDREKQGRFLDIIAGFNQIFLTVTTDDFIELFSNNDKINRIEVKHGKII